MYRIYILFFLSGIAGLIYQVVWSRLLNEIFGVTVYAVTTVLATFLGGLALGAFLLGRVADRMRNPLAFYAWLEIGAGLAALAGTWVIQLLDPLHIAAATRFAPDSLALIGARILLGAIVILPPTFLLGGTLPAVTRFFVNSIRRLGRQLSFLYALNTLGAVVGTLLAGFVLIRWIGLHPTLWLAVAINLSVGLAALLLSASKALRRDAEQASPAAVASAETVVAAPETTAGEGSRAVGAGILVVMAICGIASLGLEVVWTRMLILVVGTTTYAFVTMLASFLVGITIGSFVARGIIDRLRNVRRALGWVQVGIALATLATLPVLGSVSTKLGSRWLGGTEAEWLALVLSRFGVSFLVMLVPTTLIGMTFPLAGKIWAREVRSLGGHLGQVYGANTLGNILGAALTGFLILPALGLQRTVVFMAAISLANAAWGLHPSARHRLLSRLPRAAAVAGGLVLLVGLFVWQPRPLIGAESEAREILYYEEGLVATTMVYRDANDPRKQSMAVDRIKIGDSYGDVDMKQQCLAHFPLLLMPQRAAQEVLSIGLGTGILIGETLKHPGVERLDCVEIAPTVIEGARYFEEFNDGVLENPRAAIICDDGVNFLRRSAVQYDAIISDAKSRTSHAGNALFFSLDYYELCRDHLAPDGVMIQWIPLNIPITELPIILRSFDVVFPHTYLWVDPPASCFLVGTKQPLVLDISHIQRVLDAPQTANLRRYGWSSAYGFASLLAADTPALAPWLESDDAINSLEHPLLEFYSPRAFAVPEPQRVAENLAHLERVWRPTQTVTRIDADAARLQLCTRAAQRMTSAMRLLEQGVASDVDRAMEMIDEALALAPNHGRLQFTAGNEFYERANALGAAGQFDAAVAHLRRAIAARPDFAEAHFNLGNALASRGRMGDAVVHYQRVVELLPDFAGGHFNLANSLASQGQFKLAEKHYRRTIELHPQLAMARERLQRVVQLQQAPARQPPPSPVPRGR